jgi:hypothetical protein
VTRGEAVPARWPYPLLCLAWRLGWGGRRLSTPPEATDAGAGVGEFTDVLRRGTPFPWDNTGDGDSPFAGTDLAGGETDDTEAAPLTVARVGALLARSPLADLIPEPGRETAVRETARLICPPQPAGTHLSVPAFWRPMITAWAGPGASCHVPRPRPRWDAATWTLLGVLEGYWEDTGVTFLGRERPMLFRVAGTRRRAADHGWSVRRTLACGRTAHRIWRHWFELAEQPRLARLQRWPVPAPFTRILENPILLYRDLRVALRTGREMEGGPLQPPTFGALLASLAEASIAELRPPVVAERPPHLREAVARALLATPVAVGAARRGVEARAIWAAANVTAARLLWPLTAPWPWRPRPVVRGPLRARQEARCRRAPWRR